MNALVNEKVVNSLINDKNFRTEFKAMLNEMIDEELAKDIEEMDCDLIEECTNMLIAIEQKDEDGLAVFIPTISSKKIMALCRRQNYKALSRGMKASLIACVILLSGITANAAVYQATGHNVAKEIANSINQKLGDWGIITLDNVDTDDKTSIGIENIDVGFDDEDDETTTKRKGIEDIDVGFDDEVTTRRPGIENIDVGFDDDDETTTKHQGIEDIDVGFDDEDETTTTTTRPSTTRPDTGNRQYVLRFDAAGGECDLEYKIVTFRKAIGELPVPTREGYNFDGWYNIDIGFKYTTNIAISNKVEIPVISSTIYNLEKDAVLVAHWTRQYTITFDANGGECDVATMAVGPEGKLTEIPEPKRDGYIFLYWYYTYKKTISGNLKTNVTVKVNADTVFTEDVTVKAKWVDKNAQYSLNFDPNGGVCDEDYYLVAYGDTYGELPVPTREGYEFLGWYRDKTINSTKVTAESVHNVDGHITAYALWAEDTYTLTFDTAEGECDIDAKEVYLGQLYGQLPTPVRYGYEFSGWYTKGERGTSITATTSVPTTEGKLIEAEAHWTPAKVTVNFDGNGGYILGKAPVYRYLSAYGSFPSANCGGYEFIGWYTEPDGDTRVNEEDIITSPEPITLYAHWVKLENVATVTVHTNRSIEQVYDINYNIGDTLGSIEKPATTTSTENLTNFLGWYDDKYLGKPVPEDTVVLEDMDIYAHWAISGGIADVKIYNVKEVYELGEDPNNDEITVVLSSSILGGQVAAIKGTDLEVDPKFEEDNWNFNYYYLPVDTSTPGRHKVIFELGLSETDRFGVGTLYFTKEVEYLVTGCDHSCGTYFDGYKAPTCRSTGYTGTEKCIDCGYVINEGTAINIVPHDVYADTKVINYKAPTCTDKGYTGDTVCSACNTVLTKGEDIPALGHGETMLINAKEPTHTQRGYTGDLACSVCGKVVTKGAYISTTEEHTVLTRVNDFEPTCTIDGYTGDLVCDDCGAIIEYGSVIPKKGHTFELVDVYEPTCGDYGYTGDYICIDCGEVKEVGEFIDKLPHGDVELVRVKETSCASAGYTGDYVCTVCGDVVTKGSVIPKLEHPDTVLTGYREATCAATGYTGDYVCTECGQIATKGTTIAKLPHGETELVGYKEATCAENGYTGDYVCKVCGQVAQKGKAIRADHNFEVVNYVAPTCTTEGYSGDEVCKNCGAISFGHALDKTDHNLAWVTKKASCNYNGYYNNVCKDCGYVETETIIYAIDDIVVDQGEFEYDKNVHAPNVKVIDINGNYINSGNYSVDIERAVNPGTYTITVKFFDKYYEPEVLVSYFRILPEPESILTGVTKTGSSSMKVTWNAVDGADGYELKVLSDGGLTYHNKTINNGSTTTASFSGFRYGPDTYVIIRSFKNVTVDGVTTKVYSDWSGKRYF